LLSYPLAGARMRDKCAHALQIRIIGSTRVVICHGFFHKECYLNDLAGFVILRFPFFSPIFREYGSRSSYAKRKLVHVLPWESVQRNQGSLYIFWSLIACAVTRSKNTLRDARIQLGSYTFVGGVRLFRAPSLNPLRQLTDRVCVPISYTLQSRDVIINGRLCRALFPPLSLSFSFAFFLSSVARYERWVSELSRPNAQLGIKYVNHVLFICRAEQNSDVKPVIIDYMYFVAYDIRLLSCDDNSLQRDFLAITVLRTELQYTKRKACVMT